MFAIYVTGTHVRDGLHFDTYILYNDQGNAIWVIRVMFFYDWGNILTFKIMFKISITLTVWFNSVIVWGLLGIKLMVIKAKSIRRTFDTTQLCMIVMITL